MCKVNLLHKIPPLILDFKYKSHMDEVILYGSFRNSAPSEKHHQTKKLGRPDQIKIWPNGNDRAKDFGQYDTFFMAIECENPI